MRVSVIGGGRADEETAALAASVGRAVAARGHALVCGGLGGVMAAACRGAREAGGHTIGILPGEDRDAANPHVETAIATGIGDARNALVVMNGDCVIALPGGAGTRSELGYAGVYDRPVVALGPVEAPAVPVVETPEDAVERAEDAVTE